MSPRGAPSRARAAAVAVVLATLAGCAGVARQESVPVTDPAAAQLAVPFDIEGRLSARRGSDGVAGQFTWAHDGATDRIVLASPLGQTIARLEGDGNGVRAEGADGRVEKAAAWDALSARALGFPLPVTGLAAWIRGLPRPGAPGALERDAQGRPSLLTQDGWQIAYAYADAAAPRPSRLTLRYAGADPVELRIVVDRWQ